MPVLDWLASLMARELMERYLLAGERLESVHI
jgi:hypothetical protein